MEETSGRVPILIIGYRRPEAIQRVIESISTLSRRNIYLFCDGPQDENEAKSQRDIAQISEQLRTDFSLHTNFQGAHLGLRNGVICALDWFFSHESRGIILEDDIVVGPDFVDFCEAALDVFESDQRVQQVVGSNPLGMKLRFCNRHFLSSRMDCWGWATWRDRWLEFRASPVKFEHTVSRLWAPKRMVLEIQNGHVAAINGALDSWAYSWAWHALTNGKLSVVASVNLVENIGNGALATHTKNGRFIKAGVMGSPRQFPKFAKPDLIFVYATEALKVGGFVLARLKRRTLKGAVWFTRLLRRFLRESIGRSSDEHKIESVNRESS